MTAGGRPERVTSATGNSENGNYTLLGIPGRRATTILITLVALKTAFVFVFAWNTQLVMDEFGQLGYAKYLGNGFFDTVWPAKTVGYAVFYKVAHLIGWDAQSILLIGRMQTALLACATLAIVYACARALGEDRARALLIILVLLCFSNFIERIFRTRAEPLATFFAAAALLVILRGHADKARTVVAAGVLSGLAFLTTQKSVYFNLALGLALVGDAALARRYVAGIVRSGWLVLGWLTPILVYCLAFGGSDPVRVAETIVFGPVEVATQAAAVYDSFAYFRVQTLTRNAFLYGFCFTGMFLALLQIRALGDRRRIGLIFSVVITVLVFAHDQPWPYVFVMALPFVALWAPALFDRAAGDPRLVKLAWTALGIAVVVSFAKNVTYLRHDNEHQLQLVGRAESLLGPGEFYFDGVGMLPNRPEPSTLWLDRMYVLRTLRQGPDSEAYRIFADAPPKVVLWSYRMDAIEPVVGPLIRDSYVKIGPNLLIAGRLLRRDRPEPFQVPIAGRYRLYGRTGEPVEGLVEVNGTLRSSAFYLPAGRTTLRLRDGPAAAFVLPADFRPGPIDPNASDYPLFARVYD